MTKAQRGWESTKQIRLLNVFSDVIEFFFFVSNSPLQKSLTCEFYPQFKNIWKQEHKDFSFIHKEQN
jgi:hypothetical protein